MTTEAELRSLEPLTDHEQTLYDNAETAADAIKAITLHRDLRAVGTKVYDSIDEARRAVLHNLARAETELASRQTALEAAADALQDATAARDAAYNARQVARSTVQRLRADLIRRMPVPSETP